jgi:hypothetical protein
MPQYTPDQIEGIKRTFALYIKFPKSRWKDIEKAEKFTKEGDKIFKELQMEFLDKYTPPPEANVDLHTSKLKDQINIPVKKDLQNDFKQNIQDEM